MRGAAGGRGAEPGKGRGGRPAALLPGGKSLQQYLCDVCNGKFLSYHLKAHYKQKTNFEQLVRLRNGEQEQDVGFVDPHTKYMHDKGFTMTNLPSYLTHRMVKTVKRGPMDDLFGVRGGAVEEEEQALEVGDKNEDVVENQGAAAVIDVDEDVVTVEEDEENNEVDKENEDKEESNPRKRKFEHTDELRMSENEVLRVGQKLVEILEEKQRLKKEKEDAEVQIGENWLTGDVMMVCRPCSIFNKSPEVPAQFRTGSRGGSGTIQRNDRNGKERQKKEISQKCSRHEGTNLHIWCTMKEKKESESKATFDMRNEEAGMTMTRAAIKTFKRGGSSVDFQADLDLLSLTPGVVYAVKNNSRAAFFDIRDSVFEVVTEKMQTFFKEKVDNIAVTLDKVTVFHTSYTVIVTYFFWDGRLHVVLNQLTILKEVDYDSAGTAEMVISTLCSTLGYTRTQLANKLRHFTYDGVYASPEERVAGGGCLSLVNGVTESLGLLPGDISGTWDIGHNIQVTYN